MEQYLLSCFLPEEILKYFDITEVKELGELSSKSMVFHIYMEEKNVLPEECSPIEYESKGFYPQTYVQDFPIRGKSVYLVIKRRRWRHKIRKNEIKTRDFTLVVQGARLTKELLDFLKSSDKFSRRFD
jgi:hypothetical protein